MPGPSASSPSSCRGFVCTSSMHVCVCACGRLFLVWSGKLVNVENLAAAAASPFCLQAFSLPRLTGQWGANCWAWHVRRFLCFAFCFLFVTFNRLPLLCCWIARKLIFLAINCCWRWKRNALLGAAAAESSLRCFTVATATDEEAKAIGIWEMFLVFDWDLGVLCELLLTIWSTQFR